MYLFRNPTCELFCHSYVFDPTTFRDGYTFKKNYKWRVSKQLPKPNNKLCVFFSYKNNHFCKIIFHIQYKTLKN